MKHLPLYGALTLAMLAIAPTVACGDDDDAATQEATAAEGETTDSADAGDNPIHVEATEFEFTLGPEDAEFTTDTTGFTFTNLGEQAHEAFIIQLEEGLELRTQGIYLPADPEELRTNDQFVAEIGGTAAEPGGEAAFAFEDALEPGDYLMVCYVVDEESGQPHALLGMFEDFTVE